MILRVVMQQAAWFLKRQNHEHIEKEVNKIRNGGKHESKCHLLVRSDGAEAAG